MADRKAGHTAIPLLGSIRTAKTFGAFLADVPVQDLNRAFYNSWALDVLKDTQEIGTSDSTYNCTRWGSGSGGTASPGTSLGANNAVVFTTGGADNAETLATAPPFATPQANRPIVYLCEFAVDDISATHGFVGLARVTDPNSAGPLVASTGALGAVDEIGFHWTGAAAPVPNLSIRDGAGTADTQALTGLALADATFMRVALIVGSSSVRYYAALAGSNTVIDAKYTPTNTTLTSLGAMSAVFALQVNDAGGTARNLSVSRCFVGQEALYTAGFNRWLRDA